MGNTTYTSGLLINSCQIISAHQYSEVLNYQNLVCIQTATCVGLINNLSSVALMESLRTPYYLVLIGVY